MSDELKAREMLAAKLDARGYMFAARSIRAGAHGDELIHASVALAAIVEALRGASGGGAETGGYVMAFYELAGLLNIGARAQSPGQVWRNEMMPKILAALNPQPTPAAATVGAVDEYTPEALASHAIDFLDRKADGWIVETGVARMVQAAASVFEKSAPLDVLHRFNETLEALMHQAFVEGAFRAWSEIEQERTLTTERQPR